MRFALLAFLFVAAPTLAQEAGSVHPEHLADASGERSSLSSEAVGQASGGLLESVLVLPEAGASVSLEQVEGEGGIALVVSRSSGNKLLLIATGVAASVGTVALSVGAESIVPALALPAVSGTAVYAMGQALGEDGTLLGAVGGAALGVVPGLVLVEIGFQMERNSSRGDDDPDPLITDGLLVFGLGFLAYTAGAAAGSIVGYKASASVHRTPQGGTIPTVGLSIGL